jgi:disulfide bond formation protein DsbB
MLLLDSGFYRVIFFAQLGFYLLAGCGTIWRLRPKPLMLPFYFSMVNLATFFGFYHALTHRRKMSWK